MEKGNNLDTLKQNLKEQTETKISRELFKSMLLNSRAWDKFSLFILLTTGAIFTLIIPHFYLLVNLIGANSIRWVLIFLLLSSIFGIIAKYFSAYIEIIFNITVGLENKLPKIFTEFENKKSNLKRSFQVGNLDINIDTKKTMEPIVNQFPWVFHKFIWDAFEKGKNDILLNYKKATRWIYRRGIFISLQIIFFVITVFVFIINI